jgi:site-specific DNA-cytosine methylase
LSADADKGDQDAVVLAVSDARGHESHGVSPSLRAKNTLNDFTPIIALDREPLWRAGKQANSETTVGIAGTLNCTDDQRGGILFAQDPHGLVPEVCGTISDGAHHGGGPTGQDAYSGRIIPVLETDPVAHTLGTQSGNVTEDGTGRGSPLVAVSSGRGWWSESEVGATVRAQDSANKADTLIAGQLVNIEHGLHATGNRNSIKMHDVSEAITRSEYKGHSVLLTNASPHDDAVAHTLSTQCWKATEDGTGRGSPLVAQHDLLAFDEQQITSKTNRSGVQGAVSPTINGKGLMSVAHHGGGLNGQDANTGRILPVIATGVDVYNGLTTGDVAIGLRVGDQSVGSLPAVITPEISPALTSAYARGTGARADSGVTRCVVSDQEILAVRRLTPRECERLQGFPDDYTLIPFRGKPVADGNRYRALGNSMAVNVMRWIGERIQRAEVKR